MGIRRGTTPKLTYQLDIPVSNIQAFRIAFSQSSNILFILDQDSQEVTTEDNKIIVHFTPEQTMMFTVGIDVDTQIRAKVAGETYATDIFSVDPLCILEDGELN